MAVAAPVPEAKAAPRPESPYVGLIPYDEDHAAFFFGRSTEAAIVGANLRAARLTLLYGPSGVGKSSLLMAGVVHGLREDARQADEDTAFAVCVYRSWRDDPLGGIAEAARAELQPLAGDEELPSRTDSLAETLRAWTERTGRLLLVFDQFEEYFQYHPDETDEQGLTGFAAELARIANDPTLDVHVLLSIREDAWAKLDLFKGRIPALFGNYLRVDHLDLAAAREAIERPIQAWNETLPPGTDPYTIEPDLTEAVLEAAAGGGLALTAGAQTPTVEAAGDRVEAPFLQLVLERLWRATLDGGAHTLTLARLEALGGARRIVEHHLLDALAKLTPVEQDIAADCFRFLVSRSKTKIAHPPADLAEWTEQPEAQVTPVLDKLCTGESGRILRAVAPPTDEGSTTYELFHDVLAEPILAWRAQHDAERDRRAARRRVIRWGSVLIALVAIFAALGIWALIQRSQAQHATKSAQRATAAAVAATKTAKLETSVALASAANGQLDTSFDESLLMSLEALETHPTVQARSSMLAALETARSGGTIATLGGHFGVVRSVAFSPDRATLASAGDDGTVRLWDVRTHQAIGEPLHVRSGDAVNAVAFSPDGAMLASGGDDGIVRLWNAHTRQQVASLHVRGQKKRAIWTVAFSPDGTTLAASGAESIVRLWNVRTRKPIGVLAGHTGIVFGVAFSPDGTTLVSGGNDKTVRLWNVHTQKRIGRAMEGSDEVYGVAFSPKGTMVASGGYDDRVRLWSVRTQRQIGRALRGHTDSVESVAFSPDGRTLASSGDDKTVRLWAVATHKQIDPPRRGLTGIVYGIAFSPDGKVLAAANGDWTVRLWDLRPHAPLSVPLLGHTAEVYGVAFSPDGSVLASSDLGGRVRLWNVRTRKPIGKPFHEGDQEGTLAFSPDGTMLASTPDNAVLLRNVSTGKLIGRPLAFPGVEDVAFSPNGAVVAAGSDDGSVRLWNVHTRKQIGRPLPGSGIVYTVAFSPDGKTIAAAHGNGAVWLWSVRTHQRIGPPLRGDTGGVQDVDFSPDGTMLASANSDTTVRLWSVRTHKQIGRPLRGNTYAVNSVAFSPDGTMLLSGGADDSVRLWDVKTHSQLGRPLAGHTNSVDDVDFGPDGKTFASVGADDTVRIWDGILWKSFSDLQASVCRLVAAYPTRAEWNEAAPGVAYPTNHCTR